MKSVCDTFVEAPPGTVSGTGTVKKPKPQEQETKR